jgi:hypothetical protein
MEEFGVWKYMEILITIKVSLLTNLSSVVLILSFEYFTGLLIYFKGIISGR